MMAFKPASEIKKKRRKRIGVIRKSEKFDGFYLKVDADCSLVLYVPESGEYFKVNKVPVAVVEEGLTLFALEVDLDSASQLELKAKD